MVILTAFAASAMIPRTISYQGVLTDQNGAVVPDGSYNIHFRIYDAVTNGNLLWEETLAVDVASGRFNVVLGNSVSLDALLFDNPYWLAMEVDGDAEMDPRIQLTSAGYSLNTRTIEDGAVTSTKIAGGTVVRSINSVTDDIVLEGGGDVTITSSNDTIKVSATTGTDTDWTINGNDMYSGVSGNVGIGTMNPTTKLHVDGTTTTDVLTITGGADLAEPFPIVNDADIEPGTLVVIDEENPGQLSVSATSYDRCVAGAVSGAGGVNPGLTLSQQGVFDDGVNVALSGRVYVKATTANGAIQPGDLLTTSDLAGHAMRVTDHARAQGAIIGKAMTSLKEGTGLVLVLVSLQ
jgi:hypothetical protein